MVDTKSPDEKLQYLVSDRSWQLEIDRSVCSCAFTITCTVTNQILTCTCVEKGEHASNYRAEILGAIGYLFVMKAVYWMYVNPNAT